MGRNINTNFMWLSFLNELGRQQIITNDEKNFIFNEFTINNLQLREINLIEKNNLVETVKKYLSAKPSVLKNQVSDLQDQFLIKQYRFELTRTWLSVDAYADKNNRLVIALIHALMASFIEK